MSNTTATLIGSAESDMLLSAVRPHDYVELMVTYTAMNEVNGKIVHSIVTLEKIVGIGGAAFTSYPVTCYTVHERFFFGKFRPRFLRQVAFDVEFTYKDAAILAQAQLDATAGF